LQPIFYVILDQAWSFAALVVEHLAL